MPAAAARSGDRQGDVRVLLLQPGPAARLRRFPRAVRSAAPEFAAGKADGAVDPALPAGACARATRWCSSTEDGDERGRTTAVRRRRRGRSRWSAATSASITRSLRDAVRRAGGAWRALGVDARHARRDPRARQHRLGRRVSRRDLGGRRRDRRQSAPAARRSRADPRRQRSAIRLVRRGRCGRRLHAGRGTAGTARGRRERRRATASTGRRRLARRLRSTPASDATTTPRCGSARQARPAFPRASFIRSASPSEPERFARDVLRAGSARPVLFELQALLRLRARQQPVRRAAPRRHGDPRSRARVSRARAGDGRAAPARRSCSPCRRSTTGCCSTGVAPKLAGPWHPPFRVGRRGACRPAFAADGCVRPAWRRSRATARRKRCVSSLYGDDESGLLRPTPRHVAATSPRIESADAAAHLDSRVRRWR